MSLEEILQKEETNADCIFLYQEEGAWYAYEQSAFYCYSLFGVLDIDWLSEPDESAERQTIRVRVSEPNKFLHTSLLRLLHKRKTEYVILCKISCGGFHYWRDQLQMKFHILHKRENVYNG